MYRFIKHGLFVLVAVIAFAACKNVPDHARYIPKNAVAVFGINNKEIGKKVAWNAITGSQLWESMQKNMPIKDIMQDMGKAGIDGSSTFYGYITRDHRSANGNRVTALIPLTNAMKWEAYLKKSFEGITIKNGKSRKETVLGGDVYMAWNEDVLIIMNNMETPMVYDMRGDETDSDTLNPEPAPLPQNDYLVELTAELDSTFNISEENSVMSNKRFEKLETNGHDITLWINYDELMTQYAGTGMAAMTGGFSLSNKLWKDAAFTAGFDFEKGCITGDMHYYTPADMKQLAQEMGKNNTDKEMLERLPSKNLNLLISYHLSMKGIKQMMEELGVLGLVNLALAGQNMNADYVFDALAGDMVMSVNNFSLAREAYDLDSTAGDVSQSYNYTPDMDMVFAFKINKKENFDRLINMAVTEGALVQTTPNTYKLASGNDAITLITDGKYLVAANKEDVARGYIEGRYKAQKMPVAASKEVYGHPFGMYFNFQSMAQAIQPNMAQSPETSAMVAEAQKLLQYVAFSGGEFRNDAFEYKMNISFVNKEENSLLQLMDFAMRMDKAGKKAQVSL